MLFDSFVDPITFDFELFNLIDAFPIKQKAELLKPND
jgi:hypothetical protein